MRLWLLAASLFLIFSVAREACAQIPAPIKPKPRPSLKLPITSPGTIGIMAGDVDSSALRAAGDLARLLDEGSRFRIIPMVGRGSFQNISDLLSMRSVDLAIIQADVLYRYQKTSRQPALTSRLQYVAKLYSEEFHVLSRMQFMCLQDLTGRKVSFGPRNSGMAVTAEAVFQANNIAVEPLYLDHDEAIERLKRGDLDALIYVGGKPWRGLEKISYKDRVHFLDVEYLPPLRSMYLPTVLTAEDYPALVAPKETVATIAVASVLAVRPSGDAEHAKAVARFSERFLSEIDRLKSGPFSAKWREVNVRASLKGWQRYQPAEKWLLAEAQAKGEVPQQSPKQLDTMLEKFVESRKNNSADHEELLNQFIRWYQKQSAQQP